MAAEELSSSVVESLQVLGVSLVAEWDTLAFLYNHSICIGTAADIAWLIGYEKEEVGSALQHLEEMELVQRSRNAQGKRLYNFSEPPEPWRNACLLDLMKLAQTRTGRLAVLKHLRRPRQERPGSRNTGLRLA